MEKSNRRIFPVRDLADDELAQVKVLETYLPKQMSAEELGFIKRMVESLIRAGTSSSEKRSKATFSFSVQMQIISLYPNSERGLMFFTTVYPVIYQY